MRCGHRRGGWRSKAKVERVMVVEVVAFDWNCSRHIRARWSELRGGNEGEIGKREVFAIVSHQRSTVREGCGCDDHVRQREGLASLAIREFEHTGMACNCMRHWIGHNAAQQAIGFSGFVRAHSCVDLPHVDRRGCEGVPVFNKAGQEITAVGPVAEDVDQNSSIQQDDHAVRLLFRFAVGEAFGRMSLSLRSFLTHAALPDASSG